MFAREKYAAFAARDVRQQRRHLIALEPGECALHQRIGVPHDRYSLFVTHATKHFLKILDHRTHTLRFRQRRQAPSTLARHIAFEDPARAGLAFRAVPHRSDREIGGGYPDSPSATQDRVDDCTYTRVTEL